MSDEPEFKLDDTVTDRDLLFRVARELKTIREGVGKALFAMREAEGEVPEKMRRFANYWHDLIHIKEAHVGLGIPCPPHVEREMERCSDRFRQVLGELHMDDGTFEKIRREMAKDPENRYDHTKQLSKPKGAVA